MSSPVPPPSIPANSSLSRPQATAVELVGIENTSLLSFSFVIPVDFFFFCWVAISTFFLCFYFIEDCRWFPAMPQLCGFDFFSPTCCAGPQQHSRLAVALSCSLNAHAGNPREKTIIGHFPRTTPSTSSRVDKTALLPESRMRDDFPA